MDSGRPLVLEIAGATLQFRGRPALAGVGLTIAAGEIFALIGPNGAGKTTLVRAVCGRLGLDSGRIRILGLNPRSDRHARRLYGLVPQAIALYPHLTARENLEVLGRLSGVSRREIHGRVAAGLAAIGLEDRAGSLTAQLSGGMQRRLNIAAGTLHQPRLLLLDEPTVGVDLAAREGIHTLLRQLREAGLAILLTTHDLDQAAELADRVGIIANGRILAEDRPSALVRGLFGDAKELSVALARPPDPPERAWLESEGLKGTADGKTWAGRLNGGFPRITELGLKLARMGIPPEEVRVRESGLRGVYFALTGQELAP